MNSAIPDWLQRLFRCIDTADAAGFARFFHEDASFRFGNGDSVRGRAAIQTAVAGFFASVAGLRHELVEVCVQGPTLMCHGRVTYTRHDGSEHSVPFANVLHLSGNAILEYLIFADISGLYVSN